MQGRHIVVIGGGIAGLTAALRLRQWAEREGVPVQVTLIERERDWGGKIRTVREAGFVVEGGPDAFVTSKPWAVQLCRELGLAERLLPTNPQARQVFVLWRDRLHPLPQGFLTFTPDWRGVWATGLLSWWGKARMALGVALPKPRWDGDVSVGAFLRYYFGAEVTDRIVAPLLAGVYGGDINRLSARWVLPTLWQLAHRHRNLVWASLVRAWRRRLAPPDPTRPTAFFLTLQEGLGELVASIVERLKGCRLLVGRTAVALQPTGMASRSGFVVVLDDGERLTADAVVVATPAHAAADLLRPLDAVLADAVASVPHTDAITLSLAFDRSKVRHPLNGSGFLVAPNGRDRLLLACTWTSSKFPPRAPQGKVLLRVFVNRWVAMDDEALVRVIVAELVPLLGIDGAPERAWVFRWRQAMPQYTVGHDGVLARIRQGLQRWQHLALAGNYLTGIGIPDCIRTGTEAAERVWQRVR